MREIEVVIPEGVEIKIEKEGEITRVKVKGPKGEEEKLFNDKSLSVEIKQGKLEVKSKRKEMINTVRAHIRNLIEGVTEGFKKKMVIRYAHFPITVEVKGKEVIIKNFIGERKPRKARIMGNTKITVKGQEIIVEGTSKEDVTQTVANIRQATKIRKKDPRVFQDGIYPALE